MVSYSDWVQMSDYSTEFMVDTDMQPLRYQHITGTGLIQKGWDENIYNVAMTVEDLADARDTAFADLAPPGDPSPHLYYGGRIESVSGYFTEVANPTQYASDLSVEAWQWAWPVTPEPQSFAPWNFEDIPEGAIGVDYEGQPYDPENPWAWAPAPLVGLLLLSTTELTGLFSDLRVEPAQQMPFTSSNSLMIDDGWGDTARGLSIDGARFSGGADWLTRDLGFDVDLSGAKDWPNPTYTFRTHLTSLDSADLSPMNSTRTNYGWLLKRLRFQRTLHPPQYRWVYEVPVIAGDELGVRRRFT